MIFQKPSNRDVTAHVKQPIFPIPSSVVVKIMLSIVSILCYLSPKSRRNILGAFVNRQWHNIMEKEKKHSQNTYYQQAVTLGLAAIDRFEKPESTILVLIDNSTKARYETYPKVVHAISRVIHLIGKQGIALRGHREELDDLNPDNNPGNFLSILTGVAHYYPVRH